MSEHKQKSWFGRNWPWLIPVGGCLTVIVLFVVGIGAAFFGVSKMINNSEPFEYAIAQASENKIVLEHLGEHIETNGMMNGNLSYSNDDGEIDIVVPIKGTKGEGVLTVVGTKTDGDWSYETVYITIKATNEKINLLDQSLEGI